MAITVDFSPGIEFCVTHMNGGGKSNCNSNSNSIGGLEMLHGAPEAVY